LPHPDINYDRELLNNVNLTEYENQPASDLSFGQQKAIEIIRAISRRPRLLLLEEPISGLSLQVRPILIAELRRLQQTGVTIVIIEHDQEFLASICNRWIQIKDDLSIDKKSASIWALTHSHDLWFPNFPNQQSSTQIAMVSQCQIIPCSLAGLSKSRRI
jgi:ABC-type multidrug transport system ATPase subunit